MKNACKIFMIAVMVGVAQQKSAAACDRSKIYFVSAYDALNYQQSKSSFDVLKANQISLLEGDISIKVIGIAKDNDLREAAEKASSVVRFLVSELDIPSSKISALSRNPEADESPAFVQVNVQCHN